MKNEMNDNLDEFDKYVMSFDLEDKMIEYKYKHSYRVMHECDEISYTLNLDEDDNYLACLIGLLHDYGRFKQWKQYKTFNDNESIDHAVLGCKLLFDDGDIKNYKLGTEDYDIVKKAILNHNKYSIDSDLSVKETLHSKIIRDADKLDILYAFSNPRILELNEDDSELSSEVIIEFKKHKLVKNEYVKTVNDKILVFLAFAFDLNYDYSKQTILEKGYYDKMFEHIKNKDKFEPYFDEVKKYLKGE